MFTFFWKCSPCRKKFLTEFCFYLHCSVHQQNCLPSKLFHCHLCGKGFSKHWNFQLHQGFHRSRIWKRLRNFKIRGRTVYLKSQRRLEIDFISGFDYQRKERKSFHQNYQYQLESSERPHLVNSQQYESMYYINTKSEPEDYGHSFINTHNSRLNSDGQLDFVTENLLNKYHYNSRNVNDATELDSIIYHTDSYKCELCGQILQSAGLFHRHLQTHDKKPWRCNICHHKFDSPDNLKHHMLLHDDLDTYKCEICGKEVKRFHSLKRHMLLHSNDNRNYSCDVCNKSFRFSYHLTEHKRVHSGEKPFKCHVCMKSFTQQGSLTRHIQQVHSDRNESEPNKVVVCKSIYSDKIEAEPTMVVICTSK